MADETAEDQSLKARVRKAQDLVKSWLRQKKRERATKKKAGQSKGMTYGLVASLAVLLLAFAFCLNYVFSNDVKGTRLGLDEVTALADQGRIDSAVLKDADSELTGSWGNYKEVVNAKNKVINPFTIDLDFETGSPVNDQFSRGTFTVSLPSSGQAYNSLVQSFKTSGTHYTVDKQSGKQVVRTVTTFLLPLMILANLFALLFSFGKGGGCAIGEVKTFGTIGKGKVDEAASR